MNEIFYADERIFFEILHWQEYFCAIGIHSELEEGSNISIFIREQLKKAPQ